MGQIWTTIIIFALCSQVFLTHELRNLQHDHIQFIHFFNENVESLLSYLQKICIHCLSKLEEFRSFVRRWKENAEQLLRITEEHGTGGPKGDPEITSIENYIEIVIQEPESSFECHNPIKRVDNTITITEIFSDISNDNNKSGMLKKALINPDYFKDDIQMQPLDLRKLSPTSIEFYQINQNNQINLKEADNNSEQLNLEQQKNNERRRERNKVASRRYRERVKKDTKLLTKIREQQKERQKKYYHKMKVNL